MKSMKKSEVIGFGGLLLAGAGLLLGEWQNKEKAKEDSEELHNEVAKEVEKQLRYTRTEE